MKPVKTRTRLTSGLFLIAVAALFMAPSAAANCLAECTNGNVSGCAQGTAAGAGSGAVAGGNCVAFFGGANILIGLSVFGPVSQCSNEINTTANSCSEESDGEPLWHHIR